MITGALLLVAQSAVATQASYQIAGLKQEQARLAATHDQLQSQLAQNQAANRVATAAQELGMAHPARWEYLRAAGSPIALAPPRPSDARTAVWSGVLAVLSAVTGRTLDTTNSPR